MSASATSVGRGRRREERVVEAVGEFVVDANDSGNRADYPQKRGGSALTVDLAAQGHDPVGYIHFDGELVAFDLGRECVHQVLMNLRVSALEHTQQVKAADEKNDAKTLEALSKQADALVDKLGPEYYKLMDGLEKVDPNSSEAKEFMSILSELDKSCTK